MKLEGTDILRLVPEWAWIRINVREAGLKETTTHVSLSMGAIDEAVQQYVLHLFVMQAYGSE